MRSAFIFVAALVASAYAKTVVITVGGNTAENPGAVFQPQSVVAEEGDVVLFNCLYILPGRPSHPNPYPFNAVTRGNHTATQSTFASPCIPAHITNETINGFDSSFRNAGNGTAITELPVVITDPNTTIWFFDASTCALGGVGGININQSSWETLDGFQRNALRLNGTNSSASASHTSASRTASATATSPASTGNTATSAANRAIAIGASAVVPALALLATLSF
ncbi:hypothetical protein NLJ89_g7131 [Agrocybe chaxingu]|uniref:Uncharacterized protein n=1 Tax=Agrocybe chaxingu TaxID=84603 RepID=A0A9W8K534_9AGAR|nr:hypothetical protein NLJ89_g7131 [Agrocybe chaxingu]